MEMWYTVPMSRKPSVRIRSVAVILKLTRASERDLLMGISRYARDHCHWNLNILSHEDVISAQTVGRMIEDGIDGIIAGDNALENEIDRPITASDIPVVILGDSRRRLSERKDKITYVRMDDEDIGRFAADYLSRLGAFRTYGFIPREGNRFWSRYREIGFDAALRNRRASLAVYPGGKLTDWLASLPKPAAILAAFDELAISALEAARQLRLNVPQQLAVLGVDNDALLCDFANPPLSSILPDHERAGELAAIELDRLFRARRPTPAKTVLCQGAKIIERESTAPIAPATRLVNEGLRFIAQNALADIRVDDVVRHLGVSRRLADLRFAQFAGKTISQSIVETRLGEVAKRLSGTKLPVKHIAAACSFSNVKHLANAFRRHYGMSMTEFRNPVSS